jgi:hypothetical protein
MGVLHKQSVMVLQGISEFSVPITLLLGPKVLTPNAFIVVLLLVVIIASVGRYYLHYGLRHVSGSSYVDLPQRYMIELFLYIVFSSVVCRFLLAGQSVNSWQEYAWVILLGISGATAFSVGIVQLAPKIFRDLMLYSMRSVFLCGIFGLFF